MKKYKFETKRFGEIELESGMVLISNSNIKYILVEFPRGLCWIEYGAHRWDYFQEDNIDSFIDFNNIIVIRMGTKGCDLCGGNLYAIPITIITKEQIAEAFGIPEVSLKIVD